jgi:hypothetical protein
MMYRCAFVVSLVLFLTSLGADDRVFSHPVSDSAKGTVENICKTLTGSGIMRGSFSQRKVLKSLSREFSGSGTFVISRDEGILWNTLEPFPSVMVVTESKILQISRQGKASVLDAGQNRVFAEFSATLRSVFSGNPDALFKRFDVYYVKADARTGDSWRIGLVPKEAAIRSVIGSLVLSGSDKLRIFELREPSGDTVTYTFSNHTYSGELTIEEKKAFGR